MRNSRRITAQRIAQAVCIIATFASFLPFTPVSAESAEIAINFRVVGKQGEPKTYARVEFAGPSTYRGLTDSRGRFSISHFVTGQYRITITQGRNYQIMNKRINGNPIHLTVNW